MLLTMMQIWCRSRQLFSRSYIWRPRLRLAPPLAARTLERKVQRYVPRPRRLGTKAPNVRASLVRLLACVVEAGYCQRGHLKSRLKHSFRASTQGRTAPSLIRRLAPCLALELLLLFVPNRRYIKTSALIVGRLCSGSHYGALYC